ncbi:hypothetical protein AMELA_G00126330 [Ameiurus melas]|uniref:CDAN1-interacting nuclease 1 n=1 Tax=Ameiurus melas TaxID=219545 RepID=A0A7J6AN21_AMEME|nr:hypothetical protein AMELA_G00126330 [Ameiurus melas]
MSKMKLCRAEYRVIAKFTEQLRPTRQCMKMLKERFPNHSQSTLLSIFSLEYQKRMKRSLVKHHSDVIEDYYQRYRSEASKHPSDPVLLELANEPFSFFPSFFLLLGGCAPTLSIATAS